MKPLQILAEKYNLVHQESAGGPEIDADGDKYWHNANGLYHRTDGPAVEWADGSKDWYIDGKRHRIDGPAIEDAEGHKAWYVNGKAHRLDGPAIEWANGKKGWYVNDKRHRLDGPAVINAKGGKEWYIDDIQYTEKGFNRYLKALKDRLDILNKDNPGIEMDI